MHAIPTGYTCDIPHTDGGTYRRIKGSSPPVAYGATEKGMSPSTTSLLGDDFAYQ
jgi:hypothetical protein